MTVPFQTCRSLPQLPSFPTNKDAESFLIESENLLYYVERPDLGAFRKMQEVAKFSPLEAVADGLVGLLERRQQRVLDMFTIELGKCAALKHLCRGHFPTLLGQLSDKPVQPRSSVARKLLRKLTVETNEHLQKFGIEWTDAEMMRVRHEGARARSACASPRRGTTTSKQPRTLGCCAKSRARDRLLSL